MASGSVVSEQAGGGGEIGVEVGVGEKRKWAESKVYVRKSFKGIKDNGVVKRPTVASTSDEDCDYVVSSSGQENGRSYVEESRCVTESCPVLESNNLGECSTVYNSQNGEKNHLAEGSLIGNNQIVEENHVDNWVEENSIADWQMKDCGHHVEMSNGVESKHLEQSNPVSMNENNHGGDGNQIAKNRQADQWTEVKNHVDSQIEEHKHQVASQVELRIGAEDSQIDMDLDNKDSHVEEICQVKESNPGNNHLGDGDLGTDSDLNAKSNHVDHEIKENRAELSNGDDNSQFNIDQDNRVMQVDETKHDEESNHEPQANHLWESNLSLDSNHIEESNHSDSQIEECNHVNHQIKECNAVEKQIELCKPPDNIQSNIHQDNRDIQVEVAEHFEESNPELKNNHLGESNLSPDNNYIGESDRFDMQIDDKGYHVDDNIDVSNQGDSIQNNINRENRDIQVETEIVGESNRDPESNHLGESRQCDNKSEESTQVDNQIEMRKQVDSIQSDINLENRDIQVKKARNVEESIPDSNLKPNKSHIDESNQADDQIEVSNIKDIHMDGDGVLEIESEKVVSDPPSVTVALEDVNLKKILPECHVEVIFDKAVNCDHSENVTPVSVDPLYLALPLEDAHSIEVIPKVPEPRVEVISDKAESSDHSETVIPMSVHSPSVELPLKDSHLKEILPEPHMEAISDKAANLELSEKLAPMSVNPPSEATHSKEIRPETHLEVISDRAVSPNRFENVVPVSVDRPTLNDAAKASFPGFGGKVKIKLSTSSNTELREHKMKLENELMRVRSLMQKMNYVSEESTPEFVRPVLNDGLVANGVMGNTSLSGLANGLGAMGNGRSGMGNGLSFVGIDLATRVYPGAASVAHVPYKSNVRQFNQLRVSVMENSQGMADSFEREKRTPKENQFYRNSEFLLAKDKFPPAESNKKSKSNGKKSSGGEFGFGGGSKVFKSCSVLLEKLMKHKHGWVFNTPVDVKGLGLLDYFIIIKNPMDLGTVKSRLIKTWYKSPMEFAEDVRLTFHNAMLYNPKGQDVHIMAEILLNMFEERWGDIEVNYLRELRMAADHHEMGVPTPTSRRTVPFPAPVLPPVETRILNRSESMLHPVNPKPKTLHPAPSFRTPALKKPKAKDVDKRDMTYDEKQKLSTNLQSLPPEKLDGVIQIIKRRSTALSQNDDEIEVDIDSVDTETLWELDRFVTNYKKSLSKNRRKAELANQMRANGRHVIDKTMTQFVVPKESSGGAGNITSSSPGQGNNPVENAIGSSSSSSSSSSGSSSSDSDSDSSSDESDAGHSPGT